MENLHPYIDKEQRQNTGFHIQQYSNFGIVHLVRLPLYRMASPQSGFTIRSHVGTAAAVVVAAAELLLELQRLSAF